MTVANFLVERDLTAGEGVLSRIVFPTGERFPTYGTKKKKKSTLRVPVTIPLPFLVVLDLVGLEAELFFSIDGRRFTTFTFLS